MAMADMWKRSADSAAAVHQIRNRLQSIIIEAALLKRTPGGDQAALGRIAALAQDGASYLELFAELLPRPELDGQTTLGEIDDVFRECGIEAVDGALATGVRCKTEALAELLRTLLGHAIPYRGFRPKRLLRGESAGGRAELVVELEPESASSTPAAVTPWMRALQMARDLGGSLELHSGDPPIVKLLLPAPG